MPRKKIFLSIVIVALAVGTSSYGAYRFVSRFAGGILGTVMTEKNEFDALSKPIITDLAEKGWRPEAVRHYAASDYAATLDRSSATFDTLRRLGKVTGFSWSVNLEEHNTNVAGTAVVARDVSFENGERRVELDFLWQNNEWRLSGVQAVM